MMEQNDAPRGSSGRKWLKVLFIIVGVLVILGVGTGVYLVKASDNPAFCTTCHIMQPYYQSWKDSDLLANQHAAAGVACHDCHESSLAIQAREGINFVTGNYTVPLDKLEVSRDFCLNCHSDTGNGSPKGTTFEAAKAKTDFEESNPHDSHNGEQNCTLCHSMHEQSTVMCAQCHQFGWMDQLDASWGKQQ